jgi:hypothetical protein
MKSTTYTLDFRAEVVFPLPSERLIRSLHGLSIAEFGSDTWPAAPIGL